MKPREDVDKTQTVYKKLYDTHEESQRDLAGIEAGEVVNAWGSSYVKSLNECARNNAHFGQKFYIQVISKHLMFQPQRGMRLYFIARKTLPEMEEQQDVWSYDPKNEKLELEWSLPHRLEMKNFLNDRHKYSPKLIHDIEKWQKKNKSNK